MYRIKRKYFVFKILEVLYEDYQTVLSLVKKFRPHKTRIFSYTEFPIVGKSWRFRHKLTNRVYLGEKNSETLLASFKKNYRNEIRKNISDERFLFYSSATLPKKVYQLYAEFERQSGRKPIKERNMHGLWFWVEKNGTPMAGICAIDAHPVLKIVAIFSQRKHDPTHAAEVGNATRRLVYEIGIIGIENGHTYLDLAYINDTDPEKAGITAFKRGFNGEDCTEYYYECYFPTFRLPAL